MTEHATKAAYPILRKYIDTKSWSAYDIKSAAAHIGNIIDAEFAEVVKKAEKYDMALSTTATLQLENNELMRERDDLKKALGELVENAKAVVDCLNEPDHHVDYSTASDLNNSIAAAEKLLEANDEWLATQKQFDQENEHDERGDG